MISSLDAGSLTFLLGLDRIQRRSEKAQREMTTGLRINAVSDNPSQIPALLQTRAQLDNVTQINSNLGRVKNEVDTAESALQAAVKLIENAETLGTQGQSSFTDAQNRTEIANQLGGILQQLVSKPVSECVCSDVVYAGDTNAIRPVISLDFEKTRSTSTA